MNAWDGGVSFGRKRSIAHVGVSAGSRTRINSTAAMIRLAERERGRKLRGWGTGSQTSAVSVSAIRALIGQSCRVMSARLTIGDSQTRAASPARAVPLPQ